MATIAWSWAVITSIRQSLDAQLAIDDIQPSQLNHLPALLAFVIVNPKKPTSQVKYKYHYIIIFFPSINIYICLILGPKP